MQIRSVKENTVLNIIRVVCSMIFPLITFPYISRTIGPANYGKVNYCASIVSYFVLVATFGISDYASREGARIRDNRQRLNRFCSEVFSINLYVSMIVSLVYVVFIFCGGQLENYKVLLLIQGIQLMILPFNRCCQLMQAPGLTFSVPLFYFVRPFITLYYNILGVITAKTNLTSIYD